MPPSAEYARVSGGMFLDMTIHNLAAANRLNKVAEARGLPNAQVALALLFCEPVVTDPIIGASKPHHIKDAVEAL